MGCHGISTRVNVLRYGKEGFVPHLWHLVVWAISKVRNDCIFSNSVAGVSEVGWVN